jgi:hypothetical protein
MSGISDMLVEVKQMCQFNYCDMTHLCGNFYHVPDDIFIIYRVFLDFRLQKEVKFLCLM